MDPARFVSSVFGTVITDPLLAWDHPFFRPAPIPRSISLRQETNDALSRASLALGKLGGASLIVPDPSLFLAPSMAQEAVSSSRIEGTQASLSDVLSAEAVSDSSAVDPDLQEVQNYLAAMRLGVELLPDLPLTQRFINRLHEVLMTGVRGEEKSPGEARRSPVWIGAADATPRTAAFIPPHNEYLPEALTDWERFANGDHAMAPVLKSALLHYQFETIHPYLDGDGRIGRLLILFGFISDGILPHPTLNVSGYFEAHRREYYDRLQAVRERGEIDEWVQFFARAIEVRSDASSRRLQHLISTRERYREAVTRRNERTALTHLVEIIFRNPLVTVESVRRELNVSQPTASTAIRAAEAEGWLRSEGRWGRGGKERWVAPEIWDAISGDE